MKKIIMLFAFAFLWQFSAFAQDVLKDLAETRNLSEEVNKRIEEKEAGKGFKKIKNHSVAPDAEISDAEKQLGNAPDKLGKLIGTSFLGDAKVQDFAVKYTYAVRYQKGVLKVTYIYYRNDKGWLLTNVQVSEGAF